MTDILMNILCEHSIIKFDMNESSRFVSAHFPLNQFVEMLQGCEHSCVSDVFPMILKLNTNDSAKQRIR